MANPFERVTVFDNQVPGKNIELRVKLELSQKGEYLNCYELRPDQCIELSATDLYDMSLDTQRTVFLVIIKGKNEAGQLGAHHIKKFAKFVFKEDEYGVLQITPIPTMWYDFRRLRIFGRFRGPNYLVPVEDRPNEDPKEIV